MDRPLMLVTGATGSVGAELVKVLVAEGHRVRAMTRNVAVAKTRLGSACEIVSAELSSPETLQRAFSDVDKVFVAAPGPAVRFERNAYDAAKAAGVKHIVKLSSRGIDDYLAGTFIAASHLASEHSLRQSGMAWTILRPSFFASNFLHGLPVVAMGGARLPVGYGEDAPIDPRDVAGVAAAALMDDLHAGEIFDLTGPELLTYEEMILTIADAIGIPLHFVDVPEREFRFVMNSAGAAESFVSLLIQSFAAVKAGRIRPSYEFSEVMGYAPRPFRLWVRDHVAALRVSGVPVVPE